MTRTRPMRGRVRSALRLPRITARLSSGQSIVRTWKQFADFSGRDRKVRPWWGIPPVRGSCADNRQSFVPALLVASKKNHEAIEEVKIHQSEQRLIGGLSARRLAPLAPLACASRGKAILAKDFELFNCLNHINLFW